MTVYIYVKYGRDHIGEYTEMVYSTMELEETDDLEFIAMKDSHKLKSLDNDRTYI
jgi:hypothetical protein